MDAVRIEQIRFAAEQQHPNRVVSIKAGELLELVNKAHPPKPDPAPAPSGGNTPV